MATLASVVRELQIEWTAGETISGRLARPRRAGDVGIVLAHGAGVGQDHEFMVALRDGLAGAGLPTLTFAYPYMEAGRKAPNRLPTLLAAHRAAADRLGEYCERIVLAGKSMGARVGSLLAGDEGWPAAALVYYGYPLVSLGLGGPRDTSHLGRIDAPQLFFAGSRDRLGPPVLVREVATTLASATVSVVEGADHSFRLSRQADPSGSGLVAELVDVTAVWLRSQLGLQAGGAR